MNTTLQIGRYSGFGYTRLGLQSHSNSSTEVNNNSEVLVHTKRNQESRFSAAVALPS